MLYLVPTPVGNRSDMTPRAIEVLRQVDLIAAEDTRVSGPYLRSLGIEAPLQSYHNNNEHQMTQVLLDKLRGGADLAIVTDAGTPGISDPGFLLVRACREAGIEVIALPGATAFVPALVSSGLPAEKFFFQGFLPLKKGRKTQLAWLSQLPCTVVLYESPHRLIRCLEEIEDSFGPDRRMCASKEISKLHEQHYYGTVTEVRSLLAGLSKIQGEWVMCLAGNS
ncbi:MAG: 16S rRNA (cytidine(1402)-2'-O)-methyltransferase [Saprospiraceae bacterium]|nr:16S rRNA (cytidine(1402)-2'-O)-methyltransferase [Saprospiraceae bacterium]HMW40346.1 16S rRNA (cytidine(1402)-2'-O)-methyltransferase [Saprospiraceae bacterium]HMX88477.1 16S rRNA (cytidine(1402)-2'-O)-methyltransferase [Saprospiraceae bacterium]HMZ40342.1 16S rRNA (cytidine(1402)-2'-O)-methyltransferase [Saprospiraceae bacterium]HNA64750.1 16S rRNA (cytidine(1402)-2'-O)-methyltransferase [Saprospiraceae bacterium]